MALLRVARQTHSLKRDHAIILLMLDTGLRASELCGLVRADVSLEENKVKVLGKGNKIRSLPFHITTKKALFSYLNDDPKDNDKPFFVSYAGHTLGEAMTRSGLTQLYERLGKSAAITNVRCSPHTMRHTFAIEYLLSP